MNVPEPSLRMLCLQRVKQHRSELVSHSGSSVSSFSYLIQFSAEQVSRTKVSKQSTVTSGVAVK